MSISLLLNADQQEKLDVCLKSLEQHGHQWKCTFYDCRRKGEYFENPTVRFLPLFLLLAFSDQAILTQYALKHFAVSHLGWTDIPEALLTSYCPFCEKTAFRSVGDIVLFSLTDVD